MAERVSWETLRRLASFRAQRGCAISLYLNLDPTIAATAGEVSTRINSLLAAGERSEAVIRASLGHEQRVGLKADLDRLRGFFATQFDRGGMQGFAVFAAGLEGMWSTVELPAPVADAVHIGPDFRIAPLVPLATEPDGTLVAHVSREQGRLYRLRNGQLEEVADRSEEQPYGHHDQGGWSQARYARHIDKLVAEHLKRVATLLYELGARHPAFQCPQCGRASVTNGACPLDGHAMEPRDDGLDLAVRQTLGHGGTALPLRHRHDLEPVEGIAALLRF